MRKPALVEDSRFSAREQSVFSLFWKIGRFNADVPIDKMYMKYHQDGLRFAHTSPRARQMSIGMVVTRINRKLKGTKIVPGALKRTYRLISVD